MNKLIYIAISLLLLIQNIQAQDFKFDHLTIEEGLSNSNVYCVFQDSRGYVWIGTSNGLNRFDGYNFNIYYNLPKDRNTLSGNRITCINESPDGDILIGTWDKGFSVFDHKTEKFRQYFSSSNHGSLPSNSIRDILVEPNGNIWLATLNGLALFDKKSELFYTFKVFSHTANSATSLAVSGNNEILIAYIDEGIYKFTTHSRIFEKQSSFLSSDFSTGIKTVYKDKKGFIWVGHEGNGLYKVDPQIKVTQNYNYSSSGNNSVSSSIVRKIIEDHEGRLLIAADGGGLNVYNYNTNKFSVFTANHEDKTSLSNNQLYCMYIGKNNMLWIGTYSGGVNVYDPNKEKFYSYRQSPNGLSYKSVISIFQDKNKAIWIGTDGGGIDILQTDGKILKFKDNPLLKNLSSNIVKSIYQDSEGNMWIGTYSGGINHLNMKTKKNTVYRRSPTGPGAEHIWAIHEDHFKTLWIGSLGSGVDTFDRKNNQFVHLTPANFPKGPNYNNIMAIYEDSQHRLWLGTEGGGINLFNRRSGTFKVYRNNAKNEASLSSDDVRAIFEDSKGNLWFGTAGGGLNLMLEDQTFVHYTERDGLPSNVIYGILEDNKGYLWLSTQKGLSKFDPATKTFRNFDKNDGLQSNEFTYTAHYMAQNGKLYFGGIDGLTVFHPDSIKDNPYKPPVYITDFLLFNKQVLPGDGSGLLENPINQTKTITLDYTQTVFTFKFTALNLSHTAKNQYAYKMDNFDKTWNLVGTKREATYTNLDPGEYIFRVKACNNDGVWNETGTSIRLIITPPWYNSKWGYLLYLIISLIALIMVIRIVRKRFEKQRKKLEQDKNQKLWQQQKKYEQDTLEREKELVRLKEEKLEEEKSRLEHWELLQKMENDMKEKQLEADKEIIRLQQEKLEAELSHKNKELVSLALNISHKNETFFQLKSKLVEIAQSSSENPVSRLLSGLIKSIQSELELEEDWKQFEQHFDQVHEDFLKRLKERNPHLKPSTLRLCAYLRMKMTSKQIATLMNTTLASVEKSRYRLREKLNIEEDVKLLDFIENF
jgi:two-component system, sensor histidine kinase ChiS